jgi:hypothetical protein
MLEISKERLREIIEKYAGIEAGFGGDEVASLVEDETTGSTEIVDKKLILQLVNVLVGKFELRQIEEADLADVASIVADYFPLMAFHPVRYAEFLEEYLD